MPASHTQDLDVLIIGAGISGIGLACYLKREHPTRSFHILEKRAALGGTWDLFRYPGIRSDSDLATFGYAFRPWTGRKSIAQGQDILEYLNATVDEHGLRDRIELNQEVQDAHWNSQDGLWAVRVRDAATGCSRTLRSRWLLAATGYYRHEAGYLPKFDHMESFRGDLIHPQDWPKDFDYAGKRVIVIGSGATAVTLVPAMCKDAAHVTMVQRTPSYVLSLPSVDAVANGLRRVLPDAWAHALTRRKNIALSRAMWKYCKRRPAAAKRLLLKRVKKALPDHIDVQKHFSPPYAPWDQRLCMVPDGDFFAALSSKKASICTDGIARFTADGLILTSGRKLHADVIVTATGLNLQLLGGIKVSVDDVAVDVSKRLVFKGCMLSGVPNFAFAVGYTNASWTLKVGLVGEYLCKLMTHMDAADVQVCMPVAPSGSVATKPLMELSSGYIRRSIEAFPQQGTEEPWVMATDYYDDRRTLKGDHFDDHALRFSRTDARSTAEPTPLKGAAA